tara:strand:- start:6979 stop:8703 length:1725 start_codon:yes stop_codon:yes gene_type:complete
MAYGKGGGGKTPTNGRRRRGRNARSVTNGSKPASVGMQGESRPQERPHKSAMRGTAGLAQELALINKDQYSGAGLTMVTLDSFNERIGMEAQKADMFAQALGVGSSDAPRMSDSITVTPARIAIDGQEYNMMNSNDFLNSARMTKLIAQMQTYQNENKTRPINNYDSSDNPNLANNAPVLDLFASKNITLKPRKISAQQVANDALSGLQTDPLDSFDESRAAITRCLVNHFVDPRESLGKGSRFPRENLLIEDTTKRDCSTCTIEGLEDIGSIDLSSLNTMTISTELKQQAFQLLGGATQQTSGGGGNMIENVFNQADVPFQMGVMVASAGLAPQTVTISESLPSIILYYSMIQYVDVFIGYQTSNTGKKLMKSPIFSPLTQDMLTTLQTAGLPVLCRFRPYDVTSTIPTPNPAYSYSSQGALPIFNSCFLLTPGEVDAYASVINPAVATELYTEGCEYYYFDDAEMSQDYSGYYHIHYDGTAMADATHNPAIDHDLLYSYSAGPHPMGSPPAKPLGCASTGADVVIAEGSGTTNGSSIVDNLDKQITDFYLNGGEVNINEVLIQLAIARSAGR